jgi:soluble lytic murein transglycosylase-like protein
MADSVNNLALTVTSSRHLTEDQKVKLRKATKEFESLFVQMMLKSMRNAQSGEESNDFGGESYGGDVMKGMFDTELSRHIGQQGRFGIAETLYKKLTGESLHATPAPQSSSSSAAAHIAAAAAPAATADGTGAQSAPGTAVEAAARKAAAHARRRANSVQQSAQSADSTSTRPVAAAPLPAVSGDPAALPPTTAASAALPPSPEIGKPAVITMASAAVAVQTVAKPDAVSQAPIARSDAKRPAPLASAALDRIKSYNDIIAQTAESVGVDANLLKAMIVEESGGKQHARSSKNAKGLMQLIDTTAQSMGVKNIWDPHQNIQGGARYLKQQLEKFNGDVPLALASYNAGPGNVERYNGIPPFQETKNYVKRVMNLFTALQSLESKNDDVIE